MIPTIAPYVRNFQQKGFGLFVHYGPYVQYNQGEWALNLCKHNPEEYAQKAIACDYSSFDAKHIIAAAKASGARYVTFTTRHHDGFSLYDTRGLSDYDVMHTPNGKDIVKEFVDACHANDIMPFLYHTTLDWHHPAFEADFDAYQEYLCKSVEILCKYYGEVGGFWFDGNWSRNAEDWDIDTLYSLIRKHQPNAIIINNTGLNAQGVYGHKEIDCVTYEQGTPEKLDLEGYEKYVIGEMCYPICEHWGIADDINVKPMKSILEAFLASRRVGGNYLLGIFTNIDGSQPLLHQGYLETLGKWVHMHDAVMFDGVPCEIEGEGKNFVLRTDNKLYFFIHDVSTWGDENVLKSNGFSYGVFSKVTTPLKNGKWLGTDISVICTQDLENEMFFVKPQPYSYGQSYLVRVAEFDI